MAKAKYKVNNYEVRYNALRLISGKSQKEFDKILNKLNQGKEVKLTVKIKKDNYCDDGETSLGEEQAYRMHGI